MILWILAFLVIRYVVHSFSSYSFGDRYFCRLFSSTTSSCKLFAAKRILIIHIQVVFMIHEAPFFSS